MKILELIHSLRKIHTDKINPQLLTFKYCQGENQSFVEITIDGDPVIVKTYNLDTIDPKDDVVDNARKILSIGGITLMYKFPELFNFAPVVIARKPRKRKTELTT